MSGRSERASRGWVKGRQTILDRFWTRVDTSAGPDGCWPWTGGRQTKKRGGLGGYGFFRVNGRVVYAHRHALSLTLGRDLESGEIAIHICDNPPCCNPLHLWAGSYADNSADMVAKGRAPHGRRPNPLVRGFVL